MTKKCMLQIIQLSINSQFITCYHFGRAVDLGMIAIRGTPHSPKALPIQELHHQIVLCHIQDTSYGVITSLPRCSWCILQRQATGPYYVVNIISAN